MIDLSCELWSINRWLRYTGFRIYIFVDMDCPRECPDWQPTRVGVRFYGWRDL